MEQLKQCKCGEKPVIVTENPSNHFVICKKCNRRTNGCNDKNHAIFCWNNEFVFEQN